MEGGEEPKTSKSESEEEDYENFFLQPASSPYNIAQKVEEANKVLFSENGNTSREPRVKFRETLVDFEPDLTDDDVQSIESYNEVIDTENTPEELKYVITNGNAIYDILEEVEDDKDETSVAEEAEITYEKVAIDINCTIDDAIEEEIIEENIADEDDIPSECLEEDELTPIITPTIKKKRSRKSQSNIHIDCKLHCIEELDSRLDICISKLNINDKPLCPPLKLHKRQCCDGYKNDCRLPLYTGTRSEYGLSSAQIERQEKRKEAIKRREQKRRTLQEEYRKRKIQQNELIFCQWLKDISSRKLEGAGKLKAGSVPTTRPQTAAAVGKKRRQRPYTTATCVFIEVPQRMLQKGLRIGDLLVTDRNLSSKQLHVVAYTTKHICVG